jgi:hypothetical protein
VALRYSAGSNEGFRKGWRAGSETCADLGVKGPGSDRLWDWAGLVAALLFWRRRVDFESQAMAAVCVLCSLSWDLGDVLYVQQDGRITTTASHVWGSLLT